MSSISGEAQISRITLAYRLVKNFKNLLCKQIIPSLLHHYLGLTKL